MVLSFSSASVTHAAEDQHVVANGHPWIPNNFASRRLPTLIRTGLDGHKKAWNGYDDNDPVPQRHEFGSLRPMMICQS